MTVPNAFSCPRTPPEPEDPAAASSTSVKPELTGEVGQLLGAASNLYAILVGLEEGRWRGGLVCARVVVCMYNV
eukprot:5639212-Pyramimonas_sp.AAC.1